MFSGYLVRTLRVTVSVTGRKMMHEGLSRTPGCSWYQLIGYPEGDAIRKSNKSEYYLD
jgi:hypothetical protein